MWLERKRLSAFTIIFLSTVVLIIAVLSLIFATLLKRRMPEIESARMIGEFAPDFNLLTLNGQEVSLEQLRGKPILLNFWATWCDPCKREMPLLEVISEKYDSLLIITINEGDKNAEVESFIKKESLSLLILLDESLKIGELYKINGYPTSVFIDEKGIIQAVHLGELSSELIEENLYLIGIK